jgi:hypothetical protein
MRTAPFAIAIVIPALLYVGHLPSRPDFTAAETARIRTHLATVERALRARDVPDLSPAQRAARARNLDVLHQYWTAGVFPTNTDFPGERVPYFIDRYGIRCAMAYLIERSGHGDLVARVAATNNNARIRDLKSDPELVAWLDENGLTAAEAARIQPAYGDPQPPAPPAPQTQASSGYKATTTAAVGLSATALFLNGARTGLSPRMTGVLGVLAGASGVAAGAPNLNERGQRRSLGYVNAGFGAVSMALGVYRLAARPSMTSGALIAPWMNDRGAPGFSLTVRF